VPYANNAGVRIYYEAVGSGAPLVLLHGLGDSGAGWRESGLVERLQTRRRLILIDARGHGRSDKPHDPAAYQLWRRAGDVLAVLDALGIERAGCYGYSMGGWVGLGLARYAPERLTTLTVGGAHPYGASTEFLRRILAGGVEAWVELRERLAGPLPPAARERLLRNDTQALWASVAQNRPDISPFLADLAVPCQLVAAGADPDFAQIAQCALELPNARFVPLAGLNHFQLYLRSDLVAPIILGQELRRAAA
jgi:pimeloyl-ACP methyl ester carboxylesterase